MRDRGNGNTWRAAKRAFSLEISSGSPCNSGTINTNTQKSNSEGENVREEMGIGK